MAPNATPLAKALGGTQGHLAPARVPRASKEQALLDVRLRDLLDNITQGALHLVDVQTADDVRIDPLVLRVRLRPQGEKLVRDEVCAPFDVGLISCGERERKKEKRTKMTSKKEQASRTHQRNLQKRTGALSWPASP